MNKTYDWIDLALQIAKKAHEGQVDKAGAPYIDHPWRVSQKCDSYEAKIVALLHDTIEDTDVTPDYLLQQGIPEHLVEAVLSVTRTDGETYDDYVQRASQNPIGREVKIADLKDNMDITRLSYPLSEKDFERLNKYLKAYEFLTK